VFKRVSHEMLFVVDKVLLRQCCDDDSDGLCCDLRR